MRFIKRVNERGVLTLPTEIREALGIEDGDLVEFEVLRLVKKASGTAITSNVVNLIDPLTKQPITGGR